MRPLPDERLGAFESDFSILLGAGFADPDYTTAHGGKRVFIEDKFYGLAAPKVKTSAQPETLFRGIEDEAGEPLLVAVQINDQAGAPLRQHTLHEAGFADRKAVHSFNHWSRSSDGRRAIVSFKLRNDERLVNSPSSRIAIKQVQVLTLDRRVVDLR